MADHSLPTNTSTYVNYTTQLDGRLDDLALGLDSAFTTPTNLPTNAIRWNSTTLKHQRWNGTTWGDFTRYDININGTVGATTPASGAFTTLSSNGNTTLGDASGDTLTVNATPTFNVAIPAASGGTGQTSYAVGDLLYASTSTAISKLADVATGNSLISGGIGVAPSWGKIGLTTHVSGTLATANGGTNLTTFTSGGAVYASSASVLTTGTLPATAGGTGFASYAIGDIVYASTTTAFSKLAGVATGNSLISGGVGAAPSWGKIGLTTHVSGTLPATSGGTGLNTYAVGDLLVGGATNTVSTIADVVTGNALISGGVGVAPSWGAIGLTTHVSGTLPIGNGGTNATTADAARVNLNVITSLTGSEKIPSGTTAQRDASPSTGFFRFNTSVSKFEGYNGTGWGSVGGGATGGGSDDVFIENSLIITTSYSITAGKSAMSTGPITLNAGVTITVPSGSKWVVL